MNYYKRTLGRTLMDYLRAVLIGLANFIMPVHVAHAYDEGAPGLIGDQVFSKGINNAALATSPTTNFGNDIIFTCPVNDAGIVFDLKSISICSYIAAVDATDPITLAIKIIDNAAGAVATIVAAFNLTLALAKVPQNIWNSDANGDRVLTSGQSLLYEVTATTPDTAGIGYSLSVHGKLKKA